MSVNYTGEQVSNQEILTKAIQKAIDGGYEFNLPNWSVEENHEGGCLIGSLIEFEGQEWFSEDYPELHTNDIIFNHQFAKALWGEGRYPAIDELVARSNSQLEFSRLAGWQYHLQRMVIHPNPIEYLGDYGKL